MKKKKLNLLALFTFLSIITVFGCTDTNDDDSSYQDNQEQPNYY